MNDRPHETALATTGLGELSTLTDEQLAQREAAIIRAADAKKRLTVAALTLAYPKDFQDFDGKPYLTGDGAERLCGVGIKLSEPQFTKDQVGGHWFVECLIEAEWPACGVRCCEVGTCNTGDKLWNNNSERCEINKLTEKFGGDTALASRALLGWVMKKARQNAVSRAVGGVLGIKGLRWEDIAKIGFTPEGAGAQVQYKAKKSAKKSTGALETVDVAGLLKLAVGSKVSVRSRMLGGPEFSAKSTRFTVGDIHCKATLFVRGTDPVDDAYGPGAEVFAPVVEVSEYQGKPMYWANDGIQIVEPEGETDGE